ncbi:longitudinals lacking protein, isoforms A/B/D/L isoform X5 [Eupeodes corollae]|uniref:longitudinals lacking protein, isoforms A/B/D/L isoform X5 n=1 Tax=Eupeodes corollae TaxID=290404 RepID=UPI0024912BA2|nr:longitudinals lacking protein, isoforms A/B/D/L isoform X5 [Eupeodes corollae]
MDDDQQFCLRWNNHQSTLISVFDTLLENETLVDCTLAAEGKFLKAHKVVLSACSPYFATLLSEQYDKHPIFILKDVKYQELRAMMDYMYRGEVNISQDQLAALLKAAESLQIKGLSDNRTGSGNSSSGLGGVSQQQQQQKISAEQQHKHISVPGKLMTGSASAGYTLEQTKRSRIGPSSIDSQDLSGSREGSSSPTSRRRKKVRRRSIENVLADNHDNSNSSQVIQGGSSSIVPTTNATGTITAMLPMIGSGVGGTTTTISSSVASTITVAAQQQLQQQQQQASAATAAANIITANVTKKTESVKMGGNTDAMNAAVTAVDNIQDENAADSIDEKEMIMKEKQNHKRPKHQHEGVVATSTGKDEIVIEPKSEYDDEGNDETVEDLTLDDEEMGLEDLDHNAGPSHGGEGSSQGYAQWQVDRSQDEVFMAAQEAQQRDPQDLSITRIAGLTWNEWNARLAMPLVTQLREGVHPLIFPTDLSIDKHQLTNTATSSPVHPSSSSTIMSAVQASDRLHHQQHRKSPNVFSTPTNNQNSAGNAITTSTPIVGQPGKSGGSNSASMLACGNTSDSIISSSSNHHHHHQSRKNTNSECELFKSDKGANSSGGEGSYCDDNDNVNPSASDYHSLSAAAAAAAALSGGVVDGKSSGLCNISLLNSFSAMTSLISGNGSVGGGSMGGSGIGGHPCPECGRVYKLKSSLRNHQKWECGKEPQFQCPFCVYRAKQKMHIGRHMERMHKEKFIKLEDIKSYTGGDEPTSLSQHFSFCTASSVGEDDKI